MSFPCGTLGQELEELAETLSDRILFHSYHIHYIEYDKLFRKDVKVMNVILVQPVGAEIRINGHRLLLRIDNDKQRSSFAGQKKTGRVTRENNPNIKLCPKTEEVGSFLGYCLRRRQHHELLGVWDCQDQDRGMDFQPFFHVAPGQVVQLGNTLKSTVQTSCSKPKMD